MLNATGGYHILDLSGMDPIVENASAVAVPKAIVQNIQKAYASVYVKPIVIHGLILTDSHGVSTKQTDNFINSNNWTYTDNVLKFSYMCENEAGDFLRYEFTVNTISNTIRCVASEPFVTEQYTLPVADEDTLGGIKVDPDADNYTVDENGVLTITVQGGGGSGEGLTYLVPAEEILVEDPENPGQYECAYVTWNVDMPGRAVSDEATVYMDYTDPFTETDATSEYLWLENAETSSPAAVRADGSTLANNEVLAVAGYGDAVNGDVTGMPIWITDAALQAEKGWAQAYPGLISFTHLGAENDKGAFVVYADFFYSGQHTRLPYLVHKCEFKSPNSESTTNRFTIKLTRIWPASTP